MNLPNYDSWKLASPEAGVDPEKFLDWPCCKGGCDGFITESDINNDNLEIHPDGREYDVAHVVCPLPEVAA